MVLKIPPPPILTGPQFQAVNRWLLEIQSILNSAGTIDPGNIVDLPETIVQVNANTANIATNTTNITANTASIATINGEITAINGEITTINGEITALQARNQVLNGTGTPGVGLGNNGDLYLNNTGGAGTRLYGKIGGTWTAIA